jgi:hypothetical protein
VVELDFPQSLAVEGPLQNVERCLVGTLERCLAGEAVVNKGTIVA